jgi:hypothetical protein
MFGLLLRAGRSIGEVKGNDCDDVLYMTAIALLVQSINFDENISTFKDRVGVL